MSLAYADPSQEAISSMQHFNLAHELLSLGRTTAALSHLKATELDSAFLLKDYALYLEAESYNQAKQYQKSLSLLNQFSQRYPDNPLTIKARLLSARIMEKTKDIKNAYISYQNIDLYHPFSPEAKIARQRIAALKKSHKKGLPRFKPGAQALFDKAMLFWNKDDADSAMLYFSKLIKEYPKSKLSGKALIMLARVEIEQQNINTALTNLEKASLYQGEAGTASFYMAVAQARKDNLPGAIKILRAIQEKYPASEISDKAAYYLGYYLELDEKYNEALLAHWDLLQRYPSSPWTDDAVWRIGRIYYWSGEYDNAYKYFGYVDKFPRGDMTAQCIFFQAKAAQRLKKPEEALALYQKVTDNFDFTYYSYRARDKLKLAGVAISENLTFSSRDYKEAIHQIKKTDSEAAIKLSALMEIWEETNADNPGTTTQAKYHLDRCKMLLAMNMYDFAANEALCTIDTGADINIAQLFQQAGNYRSGINLVERKLKKAILSGQAEKLSLNLWQMAYPKAYYSQVKQRASLNSIDPYLVLAVIREESRFNPYALSRSRAHGLMQIMPATGRSLAKSLHIYPFSNRKMYDSATNIRMGTYFLSNLIDDFNGNVYLALAGYNGGPNRIKRYLKTWYNGDMHQVDIDEFVESIPIRETRLYVQKVMESYFQYKRIYGQS